MSPTPQSTGDRTQSPRPLPSPLDILSCSLSHRPVFRVLSERLCVVQIWVCYSSCRPGERAERTARESASSNFVVSCHLTVLQKGLLAASPSCAGAIGPPVGCTCAAEGLQACKGDYFQPKTGLGPLLSDATQYPAEVWPNVDTSAHFRTS